MVSEYDLPQPLGFESTKTRGWPIYCMQDQKSGYVKREGCLQWRDVVVVCVH